MIMNDKMREYIENGNFYALSRNETKEIFSSVLSGGILYNDGCVYIRRLYDRINSNVLLRLGDDIDRECFVNSISIGYFCKQKLFVGAYSISLYIFEILNNNINKTLNKNVVCIISIDDNDVSWKMHTVRSGQSWLSENLEEYSEAILCLYKTDDIGFSKKITVDL